MTRVSDPYRAAPSLGRPRGAYFCPGCGREVRRTLRSCPECHAAIASVRCAGCFHMNVPDDALCAECGEPLGLEPDGAPSRLSCTRCQLPFQEFHGGPGTLFDCGECGGQFVERALLQGLLEQREKYGEQTPRRPRRFVPDASPIVYVKCPMCQLTMNRRNFGRSSGVIVDECRAHGVWLDVGELPRIMRFVETGGLEEARRLEADERRASKSRREAEEMAARFGSPGEPAGGRLGFGAAKPLDDFLVAAVRALVDWLRH